MFIANRLHFYLLNLTGPILIIGDTAIAVKPFSE